MTAMNISLPEGLKAVGDERVQADGYSSSIEYVCELIHLEKDRRQSQEPLLAGLRSGTPGAMDSEYFATLRQALVKSARQSAA